MKVKLILTVATSLLFCFSYSQNVDVSVHFPKGSAVIEHESLSQLKIWAASNWHKRHESLLLRGHTDKDAEMDYNIRLSEQRNEAVKMILKSAGFEQVQFQAYGESWPLCNASDETCMHQNRRVEVVLFDLPEEKIMLQSANESPQIHFILSGQSNKIQGAEGTKILIPDNAFVFENGNPANENVRIELREFYNLKDCILNNLTTTCDGQMIESGGMIHLMAYSGNEEIQLNPEASVQILFASQVEIKEDDMQIFYGDISNGRMNWTTNAKGTSQQIIKLNSNEKGKMSLASAEKVKTREFYIGGKDVTVTYGDSIPTIAKYKTRSSTSYPLSDGEKFRIKAALKNTNELPDNSMEAAFSLCGFGWVNCDRFVGSPVTMPQFVKTDMNANATFLMVFDDINAIMPGVMMANGVVCFSNLPAGKKATLVCCERNGEKNIFGMKKIMISNEVEIVSTQVLSENEVNKALEIFNKQI